MKQPDVIVIGGGIGGLVCAGLLAAQGRQVFLFERGARVGGYVTGFMRDGFYFDATGAFVSAVSPGAEFYNILDALGVIHELTFLPIEAVRNIYPDFDLRLNYQDPREYLEGVKNRFPDQTDALEAYGALTARLGREFVDFENASLWKKLLLPLSFPTLVRYVRKSHAEIINKFFHNHAQITLALSALPTTLPPSRLSYGFVAVLWAKVLKSGVFYPKGGMAALSDVIEKGVRRQGVKIACNREVSRIILKGKKAVGVGLSDGTEAYADWIIGNTNPFQMQRRLPDGMRLYRGMHRLERFTPSLSAVLFYIKLRKEAFPPD